MLESLRLIAPRVIGADPQLREAIWHELEDLTLPALPGARSALDIALWDLVARRAGDAALPAARRRTHAPAGVRVDAACSPTRAPTSSSSAEVHAQGFRAVKFHAWCEPDRDLEMLRAVHAAHGDAGHRVHARRRAALRPPRRRCASAASSTRSASHGSRRRSPIRISTATPSCARRVGVPILPAGNTILDIQQVGQALRLQPWDAVRFDVTIAGGFTAARKLAGLAESWGLRVELQSWGYTLIQAANLHLGLAYEHTGYFEFPVPPRAVRVRRREPLPRAARTATSTRRPSPGSA